MENNSDIPDKEHRGEDSEKDEDLEENEDLEEEDDEQSNSMEEEEEEDDEEDDEEEDDADSSRKRKGVAKGRKSKKARYVNPLLDEQAEEGGDDEEEGEAEDGYNEERNDLEKDDDYRELYNTKHHDYSKALDEIGKKAAELEDNIMKSRIKRKAKIIPMEDEEDNESAREKETAEHPRVDESARVIENTRRIPTPDDPKIYGVRVSRGNEVLAVLALTNKYRDYQLRKEEEQLPHNQTHIFSAFWTGEVGYIYIESYDESMVRKVVEGMRLFYSMGANPFHLIPVENRTVLLEVEQINLPLKLNSYVRIKKGLFKGDIGQVVRLVEEEEKVVLKVIPRIDYSEFTGGSYSASKVRPSQALFDASKLPDEKVNKKLYPKFGGMYYEYNRNYYRDGFLYKEFMIGDCLRNAQPSAEERTFLSVRNTKDVKDLYDRNEGEEGAEVVESRSESRGERKVQLFFSGDKVKVISDKLSGSRGVIESYDNVLNECAVHIKTDFLDTVVKLHVNCLRKFFDKQCHVKVINGKYAGETGIYTGSVKGGENNSIKYGVIVTDYNEREIKVYINYIIESEERNQGITAVNGYELFDLISTPGGKVGMIIGMGAQELLVLDQMGKQRHFDIKQIHSKKNSISKNTAIMDVHHNEVRESDVVLIVEGDYKGRTGIVKRLWRSFVFVTCKDLSENGGCVVVRNRQIEIDSSSKQQKNYENKSFISSMGMKQGAVDYNTTKRGARDKNTLKDGTNVVVIQGRYKGLTGFVSDSNDKFVKVVFQSRPKPVSIQREYVAANSVTSNDNTEMGVPQQPWGR